MRRYVWPLILMIGLTVVAAGAVWRLRLQRDTNAPTPNASVSGEVVDAFGPVSGASVRIQGRGSSTVTDEAGRFSLPAPEAPAIVTAWKIGHFIGFMPSDRRPLRIELRLLPAGDHGDYSWVDPQPRAEPFSCGTCHQEIFDEWRGGAHGRPAERSRFRDLFLGIDAKGNPGGWSLLQEHPDGSKVCASCHNPAPLPANSTKQDDGTPRFGIVHCDFCHKVSGPAGNEVGLTHGRYGLDLLRPKEGQLIFGPLQDAPRAENAYSPFQKQSRLCASCHEGVVFGVRVYETYSEWQASPAGRAGIQCQDCHMKPTGKMSNIAPGHGGVDRDPSMLANHRFFDDSQRDMLQRCLRLSLDLTSRADDVRAIVEVRAEDVGHRVPTGLPDRNLTLLVEAFDRDGELLQATAGPTLPTLVGPEWQGRSGKLFAKALKDWQGRSPVPFWRAAPEFDDTRLTPGKVERLEFAFPAGATRVSAKLTYRKFWAEVTRAKGWPDDTWIVAEARKIISPKD